MNPEERLAVVVKDLAVEVLVFLGRALGGVLQPERVDVVDGLRGFGLFAVLGFGRLFALHGEIDFHGHKGAVAVENALDFELFEVFALLVGDMHDDRCAVAVALAVGHFVLSVCRADPLDGGGVGIGFGYEFNRVADHKRGVEAETEMSDDAVILIIALILLDELECAREGDLADITVDFLCGHADAVIGDGQRFCFLI